MYLPFDRQLSEFKQGLDRIDILSCDLDASDEDIDRAIDLAVRLAMAADDVRWAQ